VRILVEVTVNMVRSTVSLQASQGCLLLWVLYYMNRCTDSMLVLVLLRRHDK